MAQAITKNMKMYFSHPSAVGTCLRLIALSWMLAAAAGADTTSISVTHLRCENLIDPLGIDVAKQRLSWIIESDHQNEKQTAYEVVVDGQWDSGRVASDQSLNVEYGGKDLAPATLYYVEGAGMGCGGQNLGVEQICDVQYRLDGLVGEVDRG